MICKVRLFVWTLEKGGKSRWKLLLLLLLLLFLISEVDTK